MADVIAVVKEVGDLSEITTRNNKTVRPSLNILTVTSLQMLVTDAKARSRRGGQHRVLGPTHFMGKASRAIQHPD
jgi:hypothetical protein